MIAVDTSALMAIILEEPDAASCAAVLEEASALVISAGTVAEALIVSGARNLGPQMTTLIESLGFEVAPVSLDVARRVAAAHLRWGRGVHPAKLNFGDCFAYELASTRHCPLLFIGNDFSKTDIASAIAS